MEHFFPLRPDLGERKRARKPLRGELVPKRTGGSFLLGNLGIWCCIFWGSLSICFLHHFLVLTFEEANLGGWKERKIRKSSRREEKAWRGTRGVTISGTTALFAACSRTFINSGTFRRNHNSGSWVEVSSEGETQTLAYSHRKDLWWCQLQIQGGTLML